MGKSAWATILGTLAVLVLAGPATAQTQSVPIASGEVASLGWSASAVPGGIATGETSMLVDVTGEGDSQTYGARFGAASVPRRGIDQATEFRPFGIPTRAAIVIGAAGPRVRAVKAFFRDGSSRRTRTKPGASDWGTDYRYFALGRTVRSSVASRPRVTTKIQALDADGEVLSTTRDVSAF